MTAVKRPEIERALDRPSEAIRCFLLYGPDEAGSRALADRLAKAMGPDAERIDLDGPTLAKDPARLADEAASSSLFGGARFILVRANGDEAAEAVEALMSAPRAGNPVAIVAGALKSSSKLVKLVTSSSAAMACASYVPDAREAVPLVNGLAAPLGLRMNPDVARRLFDAAAGDRAVLRQELLKLANYLDAGDGVGREVTGEALHAIGAGEGETSASAAIDAVLTGNIRDAVEELRALGETGEDGVPLVRATLRRLLQLSALRSEADRSSLAQAMAGPSGKSLLWKDKPIVESELRRWASADLARLIERITAAQAQLLASGGAGAVTASQDLLTLARTAARGR